MKYCTASALLAATLLAACGQKPAHEAESIAGLELVFAPVEHEGAECRIRQTARIDQDRHSLYMVRGESVYRSSNSNRVTRIPLQIRFRGLDGIQTETVTTLTGMDVPCETVSITVQVDECTNQDRKDTTCPAMSVLGSSGLAEVAIGKQQD